MLVKIAKEFTSSNDPFLEEFDLIMSTTELCECYKLDI